MDHATLLPPTESPALTPSPAANNWLNAQGVTWGGLSLNVWPKDRGLFTVSDGYLQSDH